jgi:hypothetical protein
LKKSITFVLAALIVAAMIIPQSLAATSQGLFYRMDDGDRFYFTMDVNYQGESRPTEIIYFEIHNASKPIPDPLTDLGDLDYLDQGAYFENDTSMGLLSFIFIFLSQIEYPVGNWGLLNTLAATDLEGTFLIEARDLAITYGDNYWGYSYKTNNTATDETTVTADYSIFDGMLSYYNIDYRNTTTQELITEYTISRYSYHNLIWGFNDGDKFDFHLTVTGNILGFHDLDENLYIKVDEDGLPIIPYMMTTFDDLPYIGADLYWANDTISYDPFFSYSWRLAVPIGNWSLLNDFIDDKSSVVNVTLDDPDPWFWGYSWNDTCGDTLYEVHTDYLKVDGFLARHMATFTNTTSSEVIGTITIERMNLLPYTDRTDPTINHPDDVEFTAGSSNHNITWTPTDDNPTTCTISVNGTIVDSHPWTSGSSIVLALDDFETGVSTCIITVYDIAGNHATDSVLVTVTVPGGGGLPNIILDNLLYIAIGIGAVVLIGVVVILRRRS